MWTPRQGSPRNLGLAVAQLSVPIGILIAFGSPYRSRPNGSASEIDRRRDDPCVGGLRNVHFRFIRRFYTPVAVLPLLWYKEKQLQL